MLLINKFFECTIPEQCRIIYREGEFIMAIRYYEFKVQLLDNASSRMNFYADQVSLDELYSTQEGR